MINIKKTFLTFIIATISINLFSQAYISTQSHEGKINAILPGNFSQDKNNFFSIGNDGFIVKWADDGMGEHYQLSEMNLTKISQNSITGDIAVYDTDGFSINKVTVINSKTYEKKYTKRFADSISTLNYSAKGKYLIVCTTAVNGTFILNGRTGDVIKKAKDVSGVITMVKTSESEETALLYTPTGNIIYYDLRNFKVKAKIKTENKLEQVNLIGNGKIKNRILVGTKDNNIYLIDATNGKLIGIYSMINPLIFSSDKDYGEKQGLYIVSLIGSKYTLSLINEQMLIDQIKANTNQVLNPPSPLILKTFYGLKSKDSFTYASKNLSTIYLGTNLGNIYTMTDIPESESYTLFPITEKMYEKILDIDNDDTYFYFLTKDSILRTSYETKDISNIGSNNNYNNFIKKDNKIILWSKNTKRAISVSDMEGGTTTQILTPEVEIKNLRLFNNKLIYILGTSIVGLYDLETSENKELYRGTSIQDAVLIDENTLYVAKTSASSGDSPFVSVNINTKETVPLNFEGDVVFSLSYDFNESSPVYGINIKTSNNSTVTELFSYNTKLKSYSTIFRLSETDNSAFTSLNYPNIYTNLGKNQIYHSNTAIKKNSSYKRSASLPIKVKSNKNSIAILNHNGSISWYKPSDQNSLGDWYLTVYGEWFEF